MASRRKAGLYFGLEGISIAEAKGRHISNCYYFPFSKLEENIGLAEIINDKVKMVSIIQRSFREAGIEIKDIVAALHTRDVLVRFFEIPYIPQKEIEPSINFEITKFIPFRPEEIISDFQTRAKRKVKKIEVLFIGAKKEIIENYTYILDQVGLRPLALEPASFSLLRILPSRLVRQIKNSKESVAVIGVDSQEGNIVILQGGLVCMVRDIVLGEKKEALFLKLANEVRISLDYYRRHFSGKAINRIILFAEDELIECKDILAKEIGVPIIHVESKDTLIKKEEFKLGLMKAAGAALRDTVSLNVNLNLHKKKLSLEKEGEAEVAMAIPSLISVREALQKAAGVIILAVIAVACVYLFGITKVSSAKRRLKMIQMQQPSIESISKLTSISELDSKKNSLQERLRIIEGIFKDRRYLASKLNTLPKLLPPGVWLREFSFTEEVKDGIEEKIKLQGTVYLGDEKKELLATNEFLSNLRTDPEFSKIFKWIGLVSVDRASIGKWEATNFEISCK